MVESEDYKTIYQFLNESLRNQKKIFIGTDLKHEYQEAIDKLNIKLNIFFIILQIAHLLFDF